MLWAICNLNGSHANANKITHCIKCQPGSGAHGFEATDSFLTENVHDYDLTGLNQWATPEDITKLRQICLIMDRDDVKNFVAICHIPFYLYLDRKK